MEIPDFVHKIREDCTDPEEIARRMRQHMQDRRPALLEALKRDARATLDHDHGGGTSGGVLAAFIRSRGYRALAVYRLRTTASGMGIPIVPRLLHFFCASRYGLIIGDPVLIQAGVCLLHGDSVIDGFTEVEPSVVIGRRTSIGLNGGIIGPCIREGTRIEDGASVLGMVEVGRRAQIRTGALAIRDVPAGSVVESSREAPTADEPSPLAQTCAAPDRVEAPSLLETMWEDARAQRWSIWFGEGLSDRESPTQTLRELLRLCWEFDAFFALTAYRLSDDALSRGWPRIGAALRRVSRIISRVDIDPEAVLDPGVKILHGHVTVRGQARIARRVIFAPFVVIGEAGRGGPVISEGTFIGASSTVAPGVCVGKHVRVGANSNVTTDIPAGQTWAGRPARRITRSAR